MNRWIADSPFIYVLITAGQMFNFNRIHEMRQKSSLSQEDLANLTGIPLQLVRDIESGVEEVSQEDIDEIRHILERCVDGKVGPHELIHRNSSFPGRPKTKTVFNLGEDKKRSMTT